MKKPLQKSVRPLPQHEEFHFPERNRIPIMQSIVLNWRTSACGFALVLMAGADILHALCAGNTSKLWFDFSFISAGLGGIMTQDAAVSDEDIAKLRVRVKCEPPSWGEFLILVFAQKRELRRYDRRPSGTVLSRPCKRDQPTSCPNSLLGPSTKINRPTNVDQGQKHRLDRPDS